MDTEWIFLSVSTSSFDFSFFLFVSWLVEQRYVREGMGEKIGRRSRALI